MFIEIIRIKALFTDKVKIIIFGKTEALKGCKNIKRFLTTKVKSMSILHLRAAHILHYLQPYKQVKQLSCFVAQ